MLKIFRRKDPRTGRPAGNYYARGTVAGREIFRSLGTRKKADAELIAVRLQAELLKDADLAAVPPHRRAILAHQADAFADQVSDQALGGLTFAAAALEYMQAGGERRHLARVIEFFGADLLIDEVDNALLNAAAAAIYPTAAPATINRQLITPVAAVVNMAADDGRARPRKFRRRSGDNARTIWLTPAQAADLIDAADPRTQPLIEFLIGTGARVSEALQLSAPLLYLGTCEAFFPATKNGGSRMVQFPARTARALAAADLPQEGPIFRTPKGQPYKIQRNTGGQIATAFNTARDRAGLPREITPHVLRHTWATWFSAVTGDFGRLMDLGGWKRPDMAQRYRKIAPASLADDLRAHGWDFDHIGRAAGTERTTPQTKKRGQ